VSVTIGLDIGGANLKAATSEGKAVSFPFALWRDFDELGLALTGLCQGLERPKALAVTMTGELADCFAMKSEGVDRILRSVETWAGGCPIYVWTTAGRFVSTDEARAQPLATAAANWHVQATWAGRFVHGQRAVLIDCGSTTTDIIPLLNGRPTPHGLTDPERLLSGELIYQGVRRTPLCAVSHTLPFQGQPCPVAAELFATTLDVYLLLGLINPDATDVNTANGRPATVEAAHDRMARMLCGDRSEFSLEEARTAARSLAEEQQRMLSAALARVVARLGGCDMVLTSGSGEFVARRLAEGAGFPTLSLSERVSPAIAESACAYAAAVLLETKLHG